MPAAKKKFVVVTTEHRGVSGGILNGEDPTSKTITLTDAHMCVYWSVDVNGVLGLAASGPSKDCRITPAVPKIVLQGVTSVMDATDQAAEAWRSKPWR